MKLTSLDDLLAEIGLGNAMSVVVAKNLQQGEAIPSAPRIRPCSSANQRRGRGANHLRKMLPSNSGRPDYCARQPVKGWLSTTNPVVTFAATRKKPRSLWRSSGIKRRRRNLSPRLRWICSTIRVPREPDGSDQHGLFQYSKPEYGRKDGRVYSAFIRLTARDRVHLANIMRKIRVMPDVIKVTRNRN